MLPRILVAHGYWGRGGAEVDAMWLMQALQEDFELTLLTRGGWDVAVLNRYAGTNVMKVGRVSLPFARLLAQRKLGAIWDGFYQRRCRRVALGHDLRVSLSGCLDWGCPAIHRLSDVLWHPGLRARYGEATGGGYARRFLRRAGRAIAGGSGRSSRHDLFLANSHWTAEVSARECGRAPVVVYPAVPRAGQLVSWQEREEAFVCLGRIAPEKQIEKVIEIVKALRVRHGQGVTLHVVGGWEEREYGRRIEWLCKEHAEWIRFHGWLEGEAKRYLLGRCRYGLSACERESFGIATAEMMAAGVVPFVPRQGAQAELVEEATLVYSTMEEAVQRICSVMEESKLQLVLHQAMVIRSEAFAPERFCRRMRQVVRTELDGRGLGTETRGRSNRVL